MSLSKSKCWYSNNCLHILKRTVPLATMATSCMRSMRSVLTNVLTISIFDQGELCTVVSYGCKWLVMILIVLTQSVYGI